MTRHLLWIFSVLAFFSPCSLADEQKPAAQYQETSLIKNAVENFIYSQTATLPGQITVNVDNIDRHLNLAKCPELEPFMPAGGRLWGRTSVGVRCNHS
ncbi:MAG: hypothetical protein IT524_05610, partial [Nitrosomonas sp.]|nr:hypothetical protein [Nitrosomonas sp.]